MLFLSFKFIATYINRLEREDTIYEINQRLRPLIAKIENIKSLEVVDVGSTVLKSIRSALDVTLYSSSFDDLVKAGDLVEQAIYKTKGLISVVRTWHNDKTVYNLNIDQAKAAFYGLDSAEVARQLEGVIRGAKVASFPLLNSTDFAGRVWLPEAQPDTK